MNYHRKINQLKLKISTGENISGPYGKQSNLRVSRNFYYLIMFLISVGGICIYTMNNGIKKWMHRLGYVKTDTFMTIRTNKIANIIY